MIEPKKKAIFSKMYYSWNSNTVLYHLYIKRRNSCGNSTTKRRQEIDCKKNRFLFHSALSYWHLLLSDLWCAEKELYFEYSTRMNKPQYQEAVAINWIKNGKKYAHYPRFFSYSQLHFRLFFTEQFFWMWLIGSHSRAQSMPCRIVVMNTIQIVAPTQYIQAPAKVIHM